MAMSLDIVPIPSDAMSTFESVLAEVLGNDQTEIRIILTGKTGQGKSALLNSILELKAKNLLVKEGDLGDRCTDIVTHYSYHNDTKSVSIQLFDSPGLQDCTGKEDDYILELDQKCSEVNLVLICRKMTEYRLTPDDELALKRLQSAFGNEFWRHVVFIFTFANKEDLDKRSKLDQDSSEDESDSDDDDNDSDSDSDSDDDDEEEERKKKEEEWKKEEEERKKKRLKHRVEARGEEIKNFIKDKVEVTPEIIEKIPFIPAGYHEKDKKHKSKKHKSRKPPSFIFHDTWLSDLLEKCTHQMKTELGWAKLNLKNSFNLAIIINNANEDLEGQQQKKTGKDDKVPIPPAIVTSEQSKVIREKLEGLGFGVLYFSNLTKESIHQLLEAFAQAHHDDLTSFTIVVLSKGSEPLVHDADGQVVPFDEIFKHFFEGKIAEIPKSFFFHLAHTDPPNEIVPFTVPKKSVGFVVACQQTKEDVSPAVKIYVEEMKNCYTTCVGKVFQRMETTIEKQPNTKCKLQNSFEQDVTLPNCYKPSSAKAKAVYLHKRLQLYHSMWWKIRRESTDKIKKCPDEILKLLKDIRITKIVTASISLLGGGLLTVVGLALIPFTAGGSTVLTLAGAGVVATSAAAGISATIFQSVKSNAKLKEIQKHINLDQQLSYNVNKALHEYKTVVIEKVQEDIRNDITKISVAAGAIGGAVVEGTAIAVGSGAGAIGTRVGGLVADAVAQSVAETGMIGAGIASRAAAGAVRPLAGGAVSGAVEAGAAIGRVAGTGLKVVGGAAALAVSVPMDIFQIVDSSIALAKTGGKSEKDTVFQWIMGQIEYLIKGFGQTITEVGKPIKGNEKILLDIEEKYGFQMKNGMFDQKKDEECDISLCVMYAGPFVLPEGATLVSAIYDIKAGKKLKEPVAVKIQHCIEIREKLDVKEQVCFAIATLDKETNQFKFEPVDMKCSFDANYGYIELQELNCLISILHYKGKCDYDQMKYTALCSYSRVARNYWKMDIIPVKQLAAHITYVQTTNGNLVAFPFKFDGKEFIELELEEAPKDEEDKKIKGAHKEGGWLIIPCEKNKKIEREDIDNLEIQEHQQQWKEFQLPFFQLDITAVDEGADPVLKYRLPLKGTTSSVTITCEYKK